MRDHTGLTGDILALAKQRLTGHPVAASGCGPRLVDPDRYDMVSAVGARGTFRFPNWTSLSCWPPDLADGN